MKIITKQEQHMFLCDLERLHASNRALIEEAKELIKEDQVSPAIKFIIDMYHNRTVTIKDVAVALELDMAADTQTMITCNAFDELYDYYYRDFKRFEKAWVYFRSSLCTLAVSAKFYLEDDWPYGYSQILERFELCHPKLLKKHESPFTNYRFLPNLHPDNCQPDSFKFHLRWQILGWNQIELLVRIYDILKVKYYNTYHRDILL